ncbi:MAG: hypothetical protein AAB897_03380 [Patescibacteria group bacterium]
MGKKRTILAVLGRGIQQNEPGGQWHLTGDIEVCDEKFAHLPVRVPENDDDPHSIVGGGHLNLFAGIQLSRSLNPEVVVCAFGFRSNYLKSVNAPSESQVMSDEFEVLRGKQNYGPTLHIFREDGGGWSHVADRPSNTNQEIDNIFYWALNRDIYNVAIVTVTVHAARSLLMAQRHLSSGKPGYDKINLQFYASENVLLEANPQTWSARCQKLLGSRSFQRNFQLEQRGINALLSGKYNSVQSDLTAKK